MSNKNTAKLLFIDIESSPIKGFAWTMWDANILKVIEPSKVICISWKWLGSKKTEVACLADFPGYVPGELDDKALIEHVWGILDEANVVCAHNGTSFDIKKLNARFIFHGLMLPSPYEVIDTLRTSKKMFKFDQNSLDSLGDYLGEGRKLSTGGFELWDQCMKGDPKAWDRMKRYNCGDVDLLEKIYLRFRPYMDHPNLNLLANNSTIEACPACMSKNISKRGFSYTKAGRKQRFQCTDCGSWSTGKWESVKAVNGDISGD